MLGRVACGKKLFCLNWKRFEICCPILNSVKAKFGVVGVSSALCLQYFCICRIKKRSAYNVILATLNPPWRCGEANVWIGTVILIPPDINCSVLFRKFSFTLVGIMYVELVYVIKGNDFVFLLIRFEILLISFSNFCLLFLRFLWRALIYLMIHLSSLYVVGFANWDLAENKDPVKVLKVAYSACLPVIVIVMSSA